MIQTEAEEMFTLEKIFQEWIDYLIDIGKVKRESVNWKLLQEAIVEASAEIEKELENIDVLTLSGTLDYQACDDAICYLPVSVPVSFTLEFQTLDYQRSISR